jgi:hypothetical protein
LTFSRQESTKLYKRESNPKIKERLLLVLKVEGDGLLMLQMDFTGVDPGPCVGLIGSPRRASTVLTTDPRVADLQKYPKK